jgi:endo-1,4-beta-xylanase
MPSVAHCAVLPLLVLVSALSAAEPEQIPLWPNGAPGSEGQTGIEVVTETGGVRRISNVHNPSVTVHLPSKETNTGAAVIILPGGGHQYLSIENEGNAAAEWLAQRGIAGFVLKYRLARQPGSPYRVEVHPVDDAHRAIRFVRSRAKEWNLDPARVGILGFSAGGEVASIAAVRFDAGNSDSADLVERESSRPAFQAIIYGGSVKADVEIPKTAPPAFICVAYDDNPKVPIATSLFQRLRDAGVNTELHIYSQGGHGFGMRDRPLPITAWPQRFVDWLGDRGFLKTTAAAAP